jgi:hypothetical protein
MDRRLLLAATASLVAVSAVFVASNTFTRRELPHGFPSHVLALEFARDSAEVEAIVGPRAPAGSVVAADATPTEGGDRVLMRSQIQMDGVLIAIYTLFFAVAGGMVLRRRDFGGLRCVGGLAIVAGALAAWFDVRENRAMLAALGGAPGAPLSPAPAGDAFLKWMFFFTAAAAAAPVSWKRGAAGTLAAVVCAAAGLVGGGILIASAHPVRLGLAVAAFGGGVLFLLISLLLPRSDSSSSSVPSAAGKRSH